MTNHYAIAQQALNVRLARIAFDVMCPPTEYRPVYQLGYMTFQLPYRGLGYYETLQSRARIAWPLRHGATRRAW